MFLYPNNVDFFITHIIFFFVTFCRKYLFTVNNQNSYLEQNSTPKDVTPCLNLKRHWIDSSVQAVVKTVDKGTNTDSTDAVMMRSIESHLQAFRGDKHDEVFLLSKEVDDLKKILSTFVAKNLHGPEAQNMHSCEQASLLSFKKTTKGSTNIVKKEDEIDIVYDSWLTQQKVNFITC